MTEEAGLTMIVSVGDYAFNVVQEKNIYACPASYRGRDRGEYTAFYRTKPVQKITHYAKVKDIVEDDVEELTSTDKLRMFPRPSSDARVFKLEELKQFEIPIKKDSNTAIQGAWYRDLEELKRAKTISDIVRS
jgi:hypothetical protein